MSEADDKTLQELSSGGSRDRRLFYSGLLTARRGRLYLEGPGKRRMMFGTPLSLNLAMIPKGLGGPEASLVLKSEDFFLHCLLSGLRGLEESYVRGDWDSTDLSGVLAWVERNREGTLFGEGWRPEGLGQRLWLAGRRLVFSPGRAASPAGESLARRRAFREALARA